MNNTTKMLALVFALLVTASFYGQRRPGERIKALKVAFITERLNLNSEEAQAFWPIYNAHSDKLEALRRKEISEVRAPLKNMDGMSDRDVNNLLQQTIAIQQERHNENMSFIKEMGKAISAKKAFLLIKAEEDFKKRLLQQIQKRRKGLGN